MAIYLGEGVSFAVVITDPLTGAAIISGDTVTIEFYAPPKNPISTPADRVADEGPLSMTYDATVVNADATLGAWTVTADTSGWTAGAGKWYYKAEVSGAYNAWTFGYFKLVA